jgi:hypothetical protein
LVISQRFFFGSRKHIHQQYQGFFGTDPEDADKNDKLLEDDAEVDEKGSTARFYFTLTYQLAKEDITKFGEVENTNLYLCLSTASLMKDRADQQREEMRKMEKKNQMR